MHCSVLLNGTPNGFLINTRGLHKGYPLYPPLFVAVMGALSKLTSMSMEGGLLSGFLLFFPLPVGIADRLEKPKHDFLSGRFG